MHHLARSMVTVVLVAAPVLALPVAVAAAEPPVTLRLGWAEDPGRPSQAFLDALGRELADRSGGTISLEVQYKTGSDGNLLDEPGLARRVMAGEVDLALVPVRAMADAGITAFDALSAPFLIDDDALAVAVAQDPLVAPMLASLAEHGLVGLAVHPEDLRHFFTFERNGTPLVRPADLVGEPVWSLASSLQDEILTALGAIPQHTELADRGVAEGTLAYAESGLWVGGLGLGPPSTVTVDVTPYVKFQVLVAEDAAWDRLGAEGQATVRAAVDAALAAYLAARPTDAAHARAWCAAGGRVILAGPQVQGAFAEAARAVTDRLRGDAFGGPALEAIEALKAADRRAGDRPGPCEPPIDATATIPPVEPGPPLGLIPDGTYVRDRAAWELMSKGSDAFFAGNNAGQATLEVHGNTGSWTLRHAGSGSVERCPLEFSIVNGDRVRFTHLGPCDGWIDFRWRMDGDDLWLTPVDESAATLVEQRRTRANFEWPWRRTS